MEIRNLKSFAEVAHLRSFTEAGKALGYSQSTITTHVKMLENELNTRLFERIGNTVKITSAGKTLLLHTNQLLSSVNLIQNMSFDYSISTEIIKIAIPGTIARTRLPKVLKIFKESAPYVKIIVYNYHSSQVIKDNLLEGNIDMGIIMDNPVKNSKLIVEDLGTSEVYVIAHPNLSKECIDLSVPNQKLDVELILPEDGSFFGSVIVNYLDQMKIVPSNIIQLWGIEVIKNCISERLGIAALPLISIKDELDMGKYIRINTSPNLSRIPISMICLNNKWETSSLILLKKYFREYFL